MPQERKKKQFSVRVYDQKHLRNLSKRLRKVQRLLDEAAKEGAAIGARTGYKDIEKDFRFDDFPQARREIDALLRELSTALTINVEEANSEAWGMANAKNDAMVDAMLSTAGIEAAKKITQPWYNKNARALGAFQKRVKDGMGLSTDVWNLGQFKGELELALEMGLGRGKSAAELSRDVRSYLKYPDKLFRRVRDEKGVLRLSKAAKEFHPGRGVYRSSYKNALRLTATETNMAYRTADSKRWQQIDFVLGIRIQVSKTNHPVTDICDELAGDYPKDFVFTGWHPFCKCFATSILPPPDKFIEYMNASDEERKNWQWEGEVKDVPDSFKGWVQDNEERIANAKSLPYFLKDNQKYVGVQARTRAQTHEEETVSVGSAEMPKGLGFNEQNTWNNNEMSVSEKLGVVQGWPMSHEEADQHRANPNFVRGEKNGYNNNCQACVVAYEMRRRGFNVEALRRVAGSGDTLDLLSKKTEMVWINLDGSDVKKTRIGGAYDVDRIGKVKYKTIQMINKELDAATKEPGRYHLDWTWIMSDNEGRRYGHIIVVERFENGGLRLFDPQKGEIVSWKKITSLLDHKLGVNVLRVDNLMIDESLIAKIVRGAKNTK